ncbi:MAG TPA: hypothetical protein VF527_05285 [Pyrinomonadaceae bacterium]
MRQSLGISGNLAGIREAVRSIVMASERRRPIRDAGYASGDTRPAENTTQQ